MLLERLKRLLKQRLRRPRRQWWIFTTVALALGGGGLATAWTWPQAALAGGVQPPIPPELQYEYQALNRQVLALESAQRQARREVATTGTLEAALSQIQMQAVSGQTTSAKRAMTRLAAALQGWSSQLAAAAPPAAGVQPSSPGVVAAEVPIVFYHHPPPDFEEQLQYLEQTGRTVVDLDTVAAALAGQATLPAKPVVITFDDGFADQMEVYEVLQRHQMKATFYIINGGEASQWCIGAGRRYGDALQPRAGCGDSYLTWNQIRQLDRSGLITIASHTINHPNLASLTRAQQQYEIAQGKADLERQLGHAVHHFAYPYGAYSVETTELVRAAGYWTAVTTQPGTYQPAGSLFELRRVRSTWELP